MTRIGANGRQKSIQGSRQVAADIVRTWQRTGIFPDRLMGGVVADRAFVMEMVYGIARWDRMLLWAIKRCAARPADREVVPYLLVGAYQILCMDHVAVYAAVNETVDAIKAGRKPQAAGFVNGVLRRMVRDRDNLRAALAKEPIGVRESHPDLLTERWTRWWGETKTLALCRWNNNRPAVTLRVNRRKGTIDELLTALTAAGIAAVPDTFAPEQFLVLPSGVQVPDLPGYGEGRFTVQDPATSVAVDLLDPQPGELVLDACAAPGGKTFLIAERMNDTGRIVALDRDKDRLTALLDNVERLQLEAVETGHGDAARRGTLKLAAAGSLFDRILLDVPCTNTGVLRRRPDARWRFTLDRLAALVVLQKALLNTAAEFLKPGGRLVYSTCSLESEECEGLIEAWLLERSDFERERDRALFPPESRTDGVFAAALRRRQ